MLPLLKKSKKALRLPIHTRALKPRANSLGGRGRRGEDRDTQVLSEVEHGRPPGETPAPWQASPVGELQRSQLPPAGSGSRASGRQGAGDHVMEAI